MYFPKNECIFFVQNPFSSVLQLSFLPINFQKLEIMYLFIQVSLFLGYLYNIQTEMGCQGSQITTEVQPHPIDNQPYIPLKPSLKNINSLEFSSEEQKGDWLFSQGKYLEAIAVYKKIIESGYKLDFEIEGLGNFNMGVYRYEWGIYKWYDEQRKAGKFKGNVYDALALCYYQIYETNPDELTKDLFWYEDMLSEKQSYELYIGYAHIYYNLYKYDDALKVYNKFLKMKPNFINAMVSIMFLHEFNRVEKPKSIAMAKKILELDPENMYAHFVLGKNEANVDERIKKLSSGAERFPRYVRMINQVGLSYGAKKDHAMAIQYYKKCIQIAPSYAQGYQNVAFRTYMLGRNEQAVKWYYRAVEIDPKYKLAFANAIKVFDEFKWTEDDILAEMQKYPKMDQHNFCYYLGLAYYDKPRYEVALSWFKRALALNRSFNVLNSMGLAYEAIKDYSLSQECYLQSIQLNPKYKFPYYNMGLMFKHQDMLDEAIEWYRKAIENDPSYHPPYNNLGNILRDQNKLKEAVELYKKCVEIHSTYTLVYCNMAMCYLKQEMYQDAFNAFARAKELLPTDNNGLSQANKAFLKENLDKFDKEGQKWRKTGSIGLQQKEQLKSLIKSFQSNFKTLYSSEASFKRSNEQVLKPGLLQVVNLIYEDKFTLKHIQKIFSLIKHIFHDSEEYFHIIPQLFIQYFWNNTIKEKRPILSVEEELSAIIKDISSKESKLGAPQATPVYSLDVKMKNFNPPNDSKTNLFKNTAYFNSYEILYSEIVKVNNLAEQSLKEYIDFVDAVRKRSNGIPYGVNMKLPKRADQQFKVILRILEKMFKKEIDSARVKKIIKIIDQNLDAKGSTVTLLTIVHEIMEVWTKEITNILQERSKNQTQTTCVISDLLRGKIMFNTVEDLAKAIDACDKLCHLRGYQILELDNRLSKPQTMDVVLKIKVNQAVCELQLAMRQDQSKYHFIHSIYQIERSPLGCIFGSYLFMSKGFNYPILANCKDIEERLKTSDKEEDKKTVAAAQYIISSLQEKEKA